MKKQEIKDTAARIISNELYQWRNATVNITDKVAFNMREVIKKCRKNYWGVFDNPRDTQTGKEKIFIPSTEFVVETTVKNVDRDQGNYGLKATKPGRNRLSLFLTKFLQNSLTKSRFEMLLDDAIRSMSIDGTVVLKTQQDPITKKAVINKVDLLNFYIDPVAKSIKETAAVIERVVMTRNEIAAQRGWVDKDKVKFIDNVDREDQTETNTSNTRGTTVMAEVYIREGLVSKELITGKKADADIDVLAEIIVSGSGGTFITHSIREIKKKSYEEGWLTRVPGRWYGRGQAEKVIMLQAYQNMVVNIRITRASLSQLGLWKIKRNSGITPQMMGRLAVNGAIKVRNMEDVEQLVMQEASAASYRDEDVAMTHMQRITNAFEVVTGESLPATQTATTTSVQSRAASSNFVLIKKEIDYFVKRVLEDHLLPLIQNEIKFHDVHRISLDGEDLREFDNQVAEVVASTMDGDFETNKQIVIEQLQRGGKDRYVKIMDKIVLTEYDVEVVSRNSKIDESIIVTDLTNLLGIAPQYAEQIVPQILDVLGINIKLPSAIAPAAGQMQAPTSGAQSPTTQLTQAMTMEPVAA